MTRSCADSPIAIEAMSGLARSYTDRMKTRPVDPRRLDVEAFVKDAGEIDGEVALASLDRLIDVAHPDARPSGADVARWQVRGESRPVRGEAPQVWLHL
ncbi:MAG TPA: hypothetical protein VGP22_12275, partial [Albitalea sp.]|nr:hypothetical protein [Albitalea sp.]